MIDELGEFEKQLVEVQDFRKFTDDLEEFMNYIANEQT